jgi:ribosomal protein L44E
VSWKERPPRKRRASCSRCHEYTQVADSGLTIRKNCDVCHNSVAQDEAWREVLKALK